jgi:hypothetical protein
MKLFAGPLAKRPSMIGRAADLGAALGPPPAHPENKQADPSKPRAARWPYSGTKA